MRLFLGIPLPDVSKRELLALSMRLRSERDGLRWLAPESWHITLQFLGNTTQKQYACLVTRLRDLHATSVSIEFDSMDCFDRAGAFFLNVRPSPELAALARKVAAATALCGFAAEARAYHPHVTLARTQGKAGRRGLKQLRHTFEQKPRIGGFTAREFLLYESLLNASGARYLIRERFSINDIATGL